jgi:putative Mn2+ efflux pump MntP
MKKTLEIGAYFGFFQFAMPLVGYFLSARFADKIFAVDHWVAFGLLFLMGARMVYAGLFQKATDVTAEDVSSVLRLLTLAFATSVDALVAGVSFAALKVSIFPAAAFIGVSTFIFSGTGVIIGFNFGVKFKSAAELAGGLMLIFMGFKILLQDLFF